MSDLQSVVTRNLRKLMDGGASAGDALDLDAELFSAYGITSLTLVLLMTSVCEDTGTPLYKFTDEDIARLRTPRDIVSLLASAAQRSA
ncbi:MAG: phosphopantetheine-binding protein [Sulfurifustaceae bacterium]